MFKRSTGLFILCLFALLALVPAATAEDTSSVEAQAKALYEKKCGMCHGKDGVAKKVADGSANLNDPEWQASTSIEEIVQVTTEGKGKMKGHKDKMSPAQAEAVAKYILTLK